MSGAWRKAIVVGASSGIGAAIARALARDGAEVALVARRRHELDAVAETIAAAGGRARVFVHDVTGYGDVPALFQEICRALGGCDLVVYAAGVMPPIADDEYDFAKDQVIVEVNVLGAIAWLNEAAVRFERAGAGTLVGISSVAGDRGRRGNPVYCASKAALDAYLQALRHRLARRGVAVVTVKPGPVDTPMTHGRDRLPLLVSADAAATAILAAARRGSARAYVPGVWRPIMLAIRNIPDALFNRLDL
jgi:short-subunit dehydrogenase